MMGQPVRNRRGHARGVRLRLGDLRAAHLGIARPRPGHQRHRQESDDGHPGQACLPAWDDDHGGEQRPDRVSGMAADLEYALGKALVTGCGMTRHARGFRVEDGRAEPDQRHRDEHHRVVARRCEPDDADQRRAHAGDHRIGPRLVVARVAQDRLQQRRRHVESQRDQPDLREVQVVGLLEERVHRRDHRRDQVVEEMRPAQRNEKRQERTVRDIGDDGHAVPMGALATASTVGRRIRHLHPTPRTWAKRGPSPSLSNCSKLAKLEGG